MFYTSLTFTAVAQTACLAKHTNAVAQANAAAGPAEKVLAANWGANQIAGAKLDALAAKAAKV